MNSKQKRKHVKYFQIFTNKVKINSNGRTKQLKFNNVKTASKLNEVEKLDPRENSYYLLKMYFAISLLSIALNKL